MNNNHQHHVLTNNNNTTAMTTTATGIFNGNRHRSLLEGIEGNHHGNPMNSSDGKENRCMSFTFVFLQILFT